MKSIFYFLAESKLGTLIYEILSKIKFLLIIFLSISKKNLIFKNSLNTSIDVRTVIKYKNNIKIGDSIIIGANCQLGAMASIELGNHVRLSSGVIIETASLNITTLPPYKHIAKPIKIEEGVWIGTNSIILGGVTIGKYAIIGAGSVVTKDVPDYGIAVGNPCRVIRIRELSL